MVQFYDGVQVHSVTLRSYFSSCSFIEMAEATSESINSPRASSAGQKYFPLLLFYTQRGLHRFYRAFEPLPTRLSRVNIRTNTRVAKRNDQSRVCAARSARILDNDGAQYIAKHAWRAQQSWLEIVQIRNDHRPGRWEKTSIRDFPFVRFRPKKMR